MKRNAILVALALGLVVSQPATAQSDLGFKRLGGSIGFVSPEDLDATCSNSAIIGPGEFRVVLMQGGTAVLNNTGDDVRLLGTDGTTLYDTYTYGSTIYDRSFCRIPNGGAWTSSCTATKGLPNQ